MTDKIRALLAILILAGCGVLIWQGYSVPPEVRPDLSQVWVIVSAVVLYYFGSSAGSARNAERADVAVAALAATASGTTVNAQTANVTGDPVTVAAPDAL